MENVLKKLLLLPKQKRFFLEPPLFNPKSISNAKFNEHSINYTEYHLSHPLIRSMYLEKNFDFRVLQEFERKQVTNKTRLKTL